MSIYAGRIFLVACGLLTVAGGVWTAFGVRADPDGALAGTVGIAAVCTLLGVVGAIAGLLVFPAYVEAYVNRRRVLLRYVLRGPREIPADRIDEVLVLSALQIPGRNGPVSTPRFVFRGKGRVLGAYSPWRSWEVERELRALGIAPLVDNDPLTPGQARRRYPGSVTLSELSMRPAAFLVILLALGGISWPLMALAGVF
ncbi:hypothetical protein [Brevibacterium litoralis]|uniref:hypothetical protein n=1 Tax=Brevibacterium litoralis TaxID=3138935 RepID=UPI0032EFE82D